MGDSRKQELITTLCKHQREDGGWSIRTFASPEKWGTGNRVKKLKAEPEFEAPPTDGHMTGLAIIILRKAGVSAADARIQKGLAWLKSNQRACGQWKCSSHQTTRRFAHNFA